MEPFKLKSSAPPSGFARGLLVGVVVTLLAGGVAGYFYVKKQEADARQGWNLLPVVVAAQGLDAGTVLTYDMISQRQMPEQFVTPSVVRPDQANRVINTPVRVPIHPGDLLLWSHFEGGTKAPGGGADGGQSPDVVTP